jgi:ABC-type transporter Mla MlaB component
LKLIGRDEHSLAAPSINRLTDTITFTVRGPIARGDLPGLCDRVCSLLGESRADVVVCDVRGVEPDAVTVDALARLQLAARRQGCRIRLRNSSAELLELVDFMALTEVLVEQNGGQD